jgi:hypothetical protein
MAESELLTNSTFFNESLKNSILKNDSSFFSKTAFGIVTVVSLATSIDLQEPNKDLINSITNPEIKYSPFFGANEIDQETEYIDDAPMMPPTVFTMKVKLGEIRKLEFEPIEDENGFL